MSTPSDYELLRTLYKYIDWDSLLKEHPELNRKVVNRLFKRIASELESPPSTLIAYIDGTTSGNPGPSAAGVVILDEQGNTVEEFGLPLGTATSNEAEYRALIIAIERLKELGAHRVILRTDSELVQKQFTGEYRIKKSHLAKLHLQARDLLSNFKSWKVELVDRSENRRADSIASATLSSL